MKSLLLSILILLSSLRAFSQIKTVNYSQGGSKLTGYLAAPKGGGKKPGVVVIHAWMGINEHERRSITDLAGMGYYALAADIYGDGIHPTDPKTAGEQAGRYRGGDRANYRARIQAAIDEIVKAGADPDKIAVIGYCFGGTGALEAARAGMNVKAVVSFHGGLAKGTGPEATLIKAKVLVLHGADDPYESKEEVSGFQDEMRANKADWQMIYYADAVHAFSDPEAGTDPSKGAAYNPVAARRSWEHMKVFLKEVFGA